MTFSEENTLPGEADKHVDAEGNNAGKPAIDWGRWFFLGLMVIFLVAVGYRTIYSVAWNDIERTDFTVYRAAGQAVMEGTNIYEAHNIRGWLYVYPPPFAILMIPFVKLPLAWGSGLWYVLSLLCLAHATIMSINLARETVTSTTGKIDLWTLYEVPILVASPWLVSGLIRCQASGFMVWLMIAAIYWWWRGRPVLGGMSLAAAALIKAFPIALLAYFAWQRQWRFIAAFFLFLVVGGLILPSTVYGWQKNLDYWQQWGEIIAGPALSADHSRQGNVLYDQLLNSQKARNQSLEALLLTLKTPSQMTKPILAGIALGMLAVMAWLAKRAGAKNQLMVVSAFVMWNLLIPPISETHYFGLLLLPFAVLTAFSLGENDRFSRWLASGVLTLCFITTVWTNLDKNMEYYRLLCWASLCVWSTLLVLAHRRISAESRLAR
ncbi:MAG: glycosyltransferase family 87 protein [Proteobacteria bacterium]|nr:glycosyltransferase family 87 protein [Pseudomonadota bacterium]